MSNLQLLWFILIGVLFVGFFFLEGFDFGVGIATQLLARNSKERRVLVATIGPVWDGNEVWLLTAGGAMFASFPEWYASLFSGYYILLFFILFSLIIRGVSFEFRSKMKTEKGRKIWDRTLFLGSFLAPFLFGMMFTSMVAGMPLDENRNIFAGWSDYVNVFSIAGGIVMALLCFLHGLNYIRLKTTGNLRKRARRFATSLCPVLLVGVLAFAVLLYMNTDFFVYRPKSTVLILVFMVVMALTIVFSIIGDKEKLSFFATGSLLAGVVLLLFNGLFPRVLVSSLSQEFDLLIKDASSSPYTLQLMTKIAFTILPFVLAYQGWTYYVFRQRLSTKDSKAVKHV